jgi:hypothetical protein
MAIVPPREETPHAEELAWAPDVKKSGFNGTTTNFPTLQPGQGGRRGSITRLKPGRKRDELGLGLN